MHAFLTFETGLPFCIKWYYVNFDNYNWTLPDVARQRIDEAMKLLEGSYTLDDLKAAFRDIISCMDTNEVRAAKGLLG